MTAAVCCFAVPAQAEDAGAGSSRDGLDAIGLLLDDPIGLLLEDPIELLLRAYGYRESLPPPRRPEIAFDVAAMDIDVLALSTGGPVSPPARRARSGRPGIADLAARAYEPNYAKGWPAAAVPRTPDVDPPPRIVMDGDIILRVDFKSGQ